MKFDVMIMDICDPIEAGPGIALYEMEFYKFAITKLNPGGVLVTQVHKPASRFRGIQLCLRIEWCRLGAQHHRVLHCDPPNAQARL